MSDSDYELSSPYGYAPTEWVCMTFTVLFPILALVHTVQAVWKRYWVPLPTLVLGAIGETIGWAGRYWSTQNLLYEPPFLMQIASLIISPVFFSAFNYTLLGQLITRLGPEYSFLRPKLYIAIFVGSDVLSLVLQAIGGGWAASSTEPPQAATDLMIIGIIFQLGTMIVFTTLAMDFWYRTSNGKAYRRGDAESIEMEPKGTYFADRMPRINLLFVGILISSLTIIIRGFYRSVELIQGWDGYLMNHESYQDVFDGIMMIIAVVVWNAFHPGFILPKA